MNSFEKDIKLHNNLQKFQIEKSIVGTEAYYINQDLEKGVSQEEILEKARAGVYKPTKRNIKEGKAGQKYGSEKKVEEKEKINIDNKIQEGVSFWIKATQENDSKMKKRYLEIAQEKIINSIKENIDFNDPEIAFDQLTNIKSKNPLVRTIVSKYQDHLRHSINVKNF